MRRRLLVHGGAAALLLTVGFSARAQNSDQTAGDAIVHLHGIVRDGLTGKPLARALVRSADQRLAALTTSEGLFAVDLRLPRAAKSLPVTLYLSAMKPGFNPVEQFSQVTLDSSLLSSEVELRLMPSATVTGQLFAPESDMPEQVRVMLLHHSVEDGVRVWRLMANATTNSQGKFHFGDLRPGEYTVLTGEWRGENFLPQSSGSVTREYPPDFLGDVNSLSGASRLQLRYGDQSQVELHLQPVNYYPVTIPVSAPAANQSVNVQVGSGDTFGAYRLGYNSRTHAVEGSLPTGDYTLKLAGNGQPPSFAETVIHVANAPYQAAGIALGPPSAIPIHVQTQLIQPNQEPVLAGGFAGGSISNRFFALNHSQAPLQLSLRSVNGAEAARVMADDDGSGELKLDNVSPGSYLVIAQPLRGYVSSMSSGGVDLLRRPLEVVNGARPQPIEVLLRDDSGTISGTLTSSSETPSLSTPAFLFALSTDGTSRMLQSFVDTRGKFQLGNVAPGSYEVFALRGRGQEIPWRDEKLVQQLSTKAASVTVSPGQTAQVEVPLLDDADLAEE